jgi:hypothetical protein
MSEHEMTMSEQLTKDILIKAAEDVERGLWCEGSWFQVDGATMPPVVKGWFGSHWNLDDQTIETQPAWSLDEEATFGMADAVGADLVTEWLDKSKKCAEGSILFSTLLLGGGKGDYYKAVNVVESTQLDGRSLNEFNDTDLDSRYPKGSGMELGSMFRRAADTIVIKDAP